MPQRTVAAVTLTNASATSLALSQQPLAAGALTLNGALISSGTYQAESLGTNGIARISHKIAIASDADESKKTFVITGTNPDGVAQSESITGPNTTTVNSTKFYSTVSSVSIDAKSVGNITVGTANVVQTPTIMMNTRTSSIQISNAVIISGTINFTLAHTFDNIMYSSNYNLQSGNKLVTTVTYFDDPTIASKTANTAALLSLPVSGSHLTINSYSSGATFRWSIVEGYAP